MNSQSCFKQWAEPLLAKFSDETVTVFGDFCLDVYWALDISEPEISVETGLPICRVQTQRFSLGGAGSVVANLSELGVGTIRAVGAVGDDPFGKKLMELLQCRRVHLDGIVVDGSLQTMVYAKPLRGDKEESRIDFGAFNTYNEVLQDRLVDALEAALPGSDAVILNQQVPVGLSSPPMIARINRLIAAHPETMFLVDSRHFAEHYSGAMLKLNTREAGRLLGESMNGEIPISLSEIFARRIYERFGKPAFVTRGEHGLAAVGADGVVHSIAGLQVIEKTDPVGAGDAVVASIAATMAAGGSAQQAAELANVAAMITVRQLHSTGTASRNQVLEAAGDLNYVFSPQLAESPRSARHLPGTEIEIAAELPGILAIKHCIFDHDGTLSVLREGWEKVMEPVMLKAILGAHHESVDEDTFRRVQKLARDFIDRTTGIQTLVQMKGLVELVRREGFVAEEDTLDEHGYKRLYNDGLMKMIARRIEKLKNGELGSVDFEIKNATLLLEHLYRIGVKLYLASGTDEVDVVAEAEAMGYAHLFEGRIFGAVGDINIEAKKMVLERIIREHGLQGHEFATFGDGPVELRETRKRGGIAIGVASDELRRFGLNLGKRKRLIRAGANLIIPDYSQLPALLRALQLA
jgi:rfaE bifunctional protein kinase chain/domain